MRAWGAGGAAPRGAWVSHHSDRPPAQRLQRPAHALRLSSRPRHHDGVDHPRGGSPTTPTPHRHLVSA